ncbi:MAG: RMD1 family protein [Flavobacteriaceae bacterium]|nr:RMD1 family protein [Flavobacteriaceae bacterium]
MHKVIALQIAPSINIRKCREALALPILFTDSDELFLSNGEEKFVYVFQYGIVAFFNHNSGEINSIVKTLMPEAPSWEDQELSETIKVYIKKGVQEVAFDQVTLPDFDQEAIRLVMLNTSQSVALDKYLEITDSLLAETKVYTKSLELTGKFNISGIKLKRFIGKVLNIKNQISENLYIFDSPDITWENESLNSLHLALKQTFDLKDRYRYIYERIAIIKEDLELFKDIMEHRESSKLEWIIIILILVEVVDLFVIRILKLI